MPSDKDGYIKVRVLANGLEAAITVYQGEENGKQMTIDMARATLRKEKVVVGIDDDLLQSIFLDEEWRKEIVVAHGKPAEDGKDAKIKLFIETKIDVVPKEDEKGNVDFKDIQLIQNVTKGQKLAEMIPPVPGKEGMTVTNRKILPVVGKVMQLPRGEKTEVSPENSYILIASIDGNVKMKGSILNVDEVYTGNSNIDFETGNIDYIGALLIKGDVKAGFEVSSKNDIEITGLVEDAKITTSGNVIIKNGFLGKNNGLITAEGDVILKFCENQNIKAKGKIIVGEAVLHSNIQCESEVEVQGRNGAIVGGITRASKGIIVKELGNYQETKTEVIVGIDDKLELAMKEVEEEAVKIDANLDSVKKAIYALYKKKMSSGKLQDDQEKLLAKLQGLQGQLPLHKKGLEEKKEKIEKEMEKYSEASIDVLGSVYRGTKITIQKYRKSINEERKNVRYQVVDKEIKEIPL